MIAEWLTAGRIMAILDNHGGIYGKAGTVVYRRYRGMNIIQGIPKKRKDPGRASKAAALEFGLASSTARVIRESFSAGHRNLFDGGLVNRFNSAVYRSILACRSRERGDRDIHDGDVSFLEGLEFNINSRFSDVVKVRPEVSRNEAGQIVVRVPNIDSEKDIRARIPRSIEGGRYGLKFVLLALNFREEFYEYVGIRQVNFLRGHSLQAQELVFDREVPKGCFLMLSASLIFEQENEEENKWENANSVEFNPGMILATFPTEGEAEEGYGNERICREIDEANAEGRPRRNGGFGGFCGKALLGKMQMLLAGVKKPDKRKRKEPLAEPEDPVPLEGKRVRF